MANDIALFEDGDMAVPGYLKKYDSGITSTLAGGGSTKRISIKGSVFRMMVGDQEVAKNEERSMNMIIVASAPAFARTYYSGQFVEGVSSTPTCWSDDGKGPSESCADPQASMCATCPQNVKGSGDNESRACKFSARVAVVLENDPEGDVYGMSIPSMSLFGSDEKDGAYSLQTYARLLAARGFSVDTVVTKFKFDTDSAVPKLLFKAVRPIKATELDVVKALAGSEEIKEHTGPRSFAGGSDSDEIEFEQEPESTAEVVEEKPKKRTVRKKAATKKAAPKKETEEVSEPTKVSSAPEPELEDDEDDIDALLDEWDD